MGAGSTELAPSGSNAILVDDSDEELLGEEEYLGEEDSWSEGDEHEEVYLTSDDSDDEQVAGDPMQTVDGQWALYAGGYMAE